MSSTKLKLAFLASAFVLAAQACAISSLWSTALVGGSNRNSGPGIGVIDISTSDTGQQVHASSSVSFTGLDGNFEPQSMEFTGQASARSLFGRLSVYADGAVTNTYYNPNNAIFYDGNTGEFNYAGSPESLVSLTFAGFNDTLHFGGTLQSGYRARYIFRVDGTNGGSGYLADLSFRVDGYAAESFFAFDPGYQVYTWATQSYEINGITPQEVHVQFSNQFTADLWTLPDGSNYSGFSDFSATAVLDHIEITDASGNRVTGVTVTGDSGTVYSTVPEPGTIAALAIGGLALLRRRKVN